MQIPEGSRSAMVRAAFAILCVGLAGLAWAEVLEANYARETVENLASAAPGAYFSAPGRHLFWFESVADMLAPIGLVLLFVLALFRSLPQASARHVHVALGLVAAGWLLSLVRIFTSFPSQDPLVGSLAQIGIWGCALVALVWRCAPARFTAIAGGVFLVGRQFGMYHSSALFVRATGDPSFWAPAERWIVGSHAMGAAAAALLSTAFVLWLLRETIPKRTPLELAPSSEPIT